MTKQTGRGEKVEVVRPQRGRVTRKAQPSKRRARRRTPSREDSEC